MRFTVEKGFDRASDSKSSFSLQTCGSPHFVFPPLGFVCGFVGRMFSVLVSVSRRLLSRVSRFFVSFAPGFPVGSSQRNREALAKSFEGTLRELRRHLKGLRSLPQRTFKFNF